MKIVRFALLPILLMVAFSSVAQQHPNVERGFLPDKSYQLADVDAVNLFNGTVNVAIPLGQRYPVNGILSYQFLLSYATNGWDTAEHIVIEYEQTPSGSIRHEYHYHYSFPMAGMNAGAGWALNFGELLNFNLQLDVTGCVYVSPDGGRHGFFKTLHQYNPNETPYTGTSPEAVGYTRDGTYLRLKKFASTWELEFPNGDVHTFERVAERGRLTSMRDAFGNQVTISYSTRGTGEFASSSKWTVMDSTGRQHYVYFRPAPVYSVSPIALPLPEMIDYVDLAAFDSGRAEYHFEYQSDGAAGHPPSVLLMRRCTNAEPPEASMTDAIRTPMLSAIQLPLELRYEMQYDLGYDPPASPQGCSQIQLDGSGRVSGNLRNLRLTTGAVIHYTYGPYHYPGAASWDFDPLLGDFIPNVSLTLVPGIKSRIVKDRNGEKTLSNTEYQPDRYAQSFPERAQRRIVRHKNGDTVVTEERHYFTTCVLGCANLREYGLPLTREGSPNGPGPFLSTETLTRNAAGNLAVSRSTKVNYEGDGDLNWDVGTEFDLNRRLRYTRTNYDDGKYAEVTYSKFDGLGHYRQADFADNFGSGTNPRTTFTKFNPGVGTLNVVGNGVTGDFVMPTVATKWLLGTFDIEQATESNQTSTSRACFNVNGFLTSKRTYTDFGANPSPQGSDLLAIFQPDGAGNVADEQYLGGDTETPPVGNAGVPAPVTNACVSSSSETYRIRHKYQSGVRKASYFVAANGTPISPFIQDTNVDTNTGLPTARREASTLETDGTSRKDGLQTLMQYDKFGRLTSATPGRLTNEASEGVSRGARQRFEFVTNGASVRVVEEKSTGELLRERTIELDGLGRVTKEIRSMPNSVFASRQWDYDELGRPTKASSWGNGAPLFTRFEYDGYGRPTKQISPDNSETNFKYVGASSSEITNRLRIAETTDTPATTTMTYDSQGRLKTVTEPNGMMTRYTYDVGGRLTEVCADVLNDCFQRRTFTYDNRGFLTQEQTPELGVTGNGTASYRYDAKGSVVRRTIGLSGNFDVWMGYDRAGRIERVYEAKITGGVHRNLKLFTYGSSNGAADYRNGRLIQATRYNWFTDSPGFLWQIVEKYTYAGRDGRISKRETNDHECIGAPSVCNPPGTGEPKRAFEVSSSYDELGAVATVQQPACLHSRCAGVIPSRTVSNQYDQGWLESVAWNGAVASAIAYHDNGMVKEVLHGNLVKDTIALNTEGVPMPRPHMITVDNVLDVSSCAVPSFSMQPASTTITGSGSVTLRAVATGENGFPIHYHWYVGMTGDRTSSIGADSEFLTVQPTTTTRYWVEATNSCPGGAASSQTATVTVCSSPSIVGAGNPQSRTITRGQEVELVGSATGSAPLSYQWFTVVGSIATPVNGATSDRILISPASMTSYRVLVSNDCGSAPSTTATVTVVNPPTTPGNVVATSNGSVNTIVWSASSSSVGILRYEIRRLGVVTSVVAGSLTSATDGPSGLLAETAYRYQVRAVDTNGIESSWSNEDVTVTMTFADDPVQSGVTPIRGIHIGQLRRAIDAVRQAAGLPTAWPGSYPAASGVFLAADMTEMRTRLNEARLVIGLPDIAFSGPVTTGGAFRAPDIQALRNGVK